ncbi:MAG: enolase C-terminal domain-like protein [Pseudomonadales bacterium]
MSQSPRVSAVALYGVGPDSERITWSAQLGPMYEAMIIAKLTLEDGTQAIAGATTYTEHQFDHTLLESAALSAPFLLGREVADCAAIYSDLMSRYVPLKHLSSSLYDIALHDARGKLAGLPIYQLLGAAQHSVRAYASSPLLPQISDYIDYCHAMLAQGYNAIKIHPPCTFDQDYALVEALAEEFKGDTIGWSLDVDENYSFSEALKMGQLLEELGWDFFEAPLPDMQLEAYAELRNRLSVDIVAGGNSIVNLHLFEHALNMGCWDRGRFDVTGIGGFTNGTKAMALCQARGLKTEVQSWGYTLTQAANLHMMLSHANCEYFEQAAPFEKYEIGAKQVFRPDDSGQIHPSHLPGLGVELDWDQLQPFIYSERHFKL